MAPVPISNKIKDGSAAPPSSHLPLHQLVPEPTLLTGQCPSTLWCLILSGKVTLPFQEVSLPYCRGWLAEKELREFGKSQGPGLWLCVRRAWAPPEGLQPGSQYSGLSIFSSQCLARSKYPILSGPLFPSQPGAFNSISFTGRRVCARVMERRYYVALATQTPQV